MSESFVSQIPLPDFSLWQRPEDKRTPFLFELEITARCNNNCRHCYINLPAHDKKAKNKELSKDEIKKIADGAVSLGALWCLISGGEPLLREDFFDIYLYLKKKGLLVSVFTNATLITDKHIKFFKKFPPRDVEVTVYGTTKETYEKVTRIAGSFSAFMQGLNLLLQNGIKVRFKTMALRSNLKELLKIADFCRERTKDYFRFDPFLHLRFDRDSKRNKQIKSERLSAEEIVAIEKADPQRSSALENNCDKLIVPDFAHLNCNHLFRCGTGRASFAVSYDGFLRSCSSLWHPDCMYDLRKETLSNAWQGFVSKVIDRRSNRREFLDKCHRCPLINLCFWCPANAYLETGQLDKPIRYFCRVAHARAKALGKEYGEQK